MISDRSEPGSQIAFVQEFIMEHERAGREMRKRKQPVGASPSESGFRTLLVSVDLTPSSDRVLGRLARLPLADDARVTLLHVVPGDLLPTERRRAERDAKETLAEEVRHLRKHLHPRVRIESLVKVGIAPKEIAAQAAAVRAELIVMGRGGGRPLRDTFLGSTAERVIRQSASCVGGSTAGARGL